MHLLLSYIFVYLPMELTREHDIFLIWKILTVDRFQHKHSTVKRRQGWTQIAGMINSIVSPRFRVSQTSVRKIFTTWVKEFTKKMENQEKASDINLADLAENEQGREEIISIKKHVSFIHKNEQQPQKEAWANVQENRKCCLEKFVETKWRTGEANNEKDTKKKKKD